MPFVIRPSGESRDVSLMSRGCTNLKRFLRARVWLAKDEYYTLIGDAYVTGMMRGELWPEDSSKLQVIRLK